MPNKQLLFQLEINPKGLYIYIYIYGKLFYFLDRSIEIEETDQRERITKFCRQKRRKSLRCGGSLLGFGNAGTFS
jgi:hypothetical protein